MQTIQTRDVLMWRVVLTDDTHIQEYDEARPDGRGFLEVEQARIKSVELLGMTPEQYRCVDVPEDATPVFFRRRAISYNSEADTQTPQGTTHCIGWKHGESGVYLFVFEDGHTLLTSDLQAV